MPFASRMSKTLPKLGILAGGGQFPAQVIDSCKQQNRPYHIIAFISQTPQKIVENEPHTWVRLGAGGEALKILKNQGVEEIIFAGSITRPSLADLRPDWWGVKFLARSNALAKGDDGLLGAIVETLESEEGFKVVGVEDLVPGLLAPLGRLCGTADLAQHLRDIQIGREAALSLGKEDKGQGVVVRAGKIIGYENAAGTDALLNDVRKLSPDVSLERKTGVLVKMSKPGQETRADLPAIGPETIDGVREAALAGIIVEADKSLILDKAALIDKASEADIFVVAIPSSGDLDFQAEVWQ